MQSNGSPVFPLLPGGSEAQKHTIGQFQEVMRDQIQDPFLKEVLVPDWDAGCRRLAPGVGYLSDLASHKSSVAYGEIVRIGPQGPIKPCTPSGSAYLCHRFDKSFKSLFKLVGNDEHPLSTCTMYLIRRAAAVAAVA